MSTNNKRVVIIGAGFGGLRAAKALRKAPVQVTVIDRSNHHLFQPLLYQVATAGLTAEEIAVPIRSVLRKQANTEVLLGDVVAVDPRGQTLELADGHTLSYDYLVVAAGAQTNYHGHPEWQQHTVGLKDLRDAYSIRRRVLLAFEAAERETDDAVRRRLLTFTVIGGGPTGVEMAGALSELSRAVLADDFRHIEGSMIRVLLVEMGPRVLAPFAEQLSQRAQADLRNLGVEVRTHAKVLDINAEGVQLEDGFIPTALVCWAAGVAPVPLAHRLGVPTLRSGHIEVSEDCSVPGYPNMFVIGDMASFIPQVPKPSGATPGPPARPLPGLAPVAMQQAISVANNIMRSLHDEPRQPFSYFDKGIMATIGTSSAVLQFGKIRMAGFLAWLGWIVVHVYYIIGFRNRTLVLFEWFWAYLTRRRGARVIANRDVPTLAHAVATASEPAHPAPVAAQQATLH